MQIRRVLLFSLVVSRFLVFHNLSNSPCVFKLITNCMHECGSYAKTLDACNNKYITHGTTRDYIAPSRPGKLGQVIILIKTMYPVVSDPEI